MQRVPYQTVYWQRCLMESFFVACFIGSGYAYQSVTETLNFFHLPLGLMLAFCWLRGSGTLIPAAFGLLIALLALETPLADAQTLIAFLLMKTVLIWIGWYQLGPIAPCLEPRKLGMATLWMFFVLSLSAYGWHGSWNQVAAEGAGVLMIVPLLLVWDHYLPDSVKPLKVKNRQIVETVCMIVWLVLSVIPVFSISIALAGIALFGVYTAQRYQLYGATLMQVSLICLLAAVDKKEIILEWQLWLPVALICLTFLWLFIGIRSFFLSVD